MPDIAPSNQPSNALTQDMLDSNSTLAPDSDQMIATQKAVKTYVDGIRRKTYINGSLKDHILDWTDSVTTSSGQAVFYVTSDRTNSGSAMATDLYPDSIQVNYIDPTGVYATGIPVISSDKKSITIPITKQSFTGVTVLGINVLGSASQAAIPNGVVVKMQVIGSAV